MSSRVSSIASVPDPTIGLPRSMEGEAGKAIAARPPPSDDRSDLRLIIEEDQSTGDFIYKTLDRRTGEVVSQLPRKEVLRLRHEREYRAGALISAKA